MNPFGFQSYQEAFDAAIKQSKGMLMDTKLYVKHNGASYRVGFTPDDKEDGYIYNGEFHAKAKD